MAKKAKYIKLSNPEFDGDSKETRTINVNLKDGIRGEYSVDYRKIVNYLFDNKKWNEEKANKWMEKNEDIKITPLTVKSIIKKIKGKKGKGRMMAVASEEVEDRERETLSIEGWDTRAFEKNNVMLWMHNRVIGHNGLPIGSVEDLKVRTVNGKRKLTFTPVFDDSTEFNRTVKKFYEDGIMNSFSVGFLPTEREGDKYIKQELLEISAVAVPALASAMVLERAKELNLKKDHVLELIDFKGTIPFKGYKTVSENREWDANAVTNRGRVWAGGPSKEDIAWSKYRKLFTWYDADDTDNFGAYKLPHHDIVNGEPVTVWRGVATAMAALLGARGGVDVPQPDRRKIYNHLAKHYKQFDKEVPDFKSVENQVLKGLFEIERERLERKYERHTKAKIQYIASYIKQQGKEEKKKETKLLKKSGKTDLTKTLYDVLSVVHKGLESVEEKSSGNTKKGGKIKNGNRKEKTTRND